MEFENKANNVVIVGYLSKVAFPGLTQEDTCPLTITGGS
jgi:hypothetical protein